MKFRLGLLVLLVSSLTHAEPIMYKENIAYQKITRKYRMDHTFTLSTHPLGQKNQGFGYRFGYSLGAFAVDLGFQYSKASWQTLTAERSTVDTVGAGSGGALDQPISEINRSRHGTDPWTQTLFEAGLSYRGRLFPLSDRNWIQYSRISFGYSKLKDETYDLPFNGFLFGVEAGLQYLMSDHFALSPNLNYHIGYAYRADRAVSENTRISLSGIQFALGLTYLPQ